MNGVPTTENRWEQEMRKLRQMAREFDARALRFSQQVENAEETAPETEAEFQQLNEFAQRLAEQFEIVQTLGPPPS